MRAYSFGELFSGPGGMSLGLKLAAKKLGISVKHKWAIEIDASAASTYKRNFSEARVVTSDVRRVDLGALERVSGMAFGFPCNDFSIVGEQRGVSGKFGPLYRHCVEAVRIHQPRWFVAENVGGIRSADGGRALPKILSEFEELGYTITAHLFRFEDYGVPQNRHRVLIVGIRDSLRKQFRVPAPSNVKRSARQAIESPPIQANAANHELTRQAPAVVERLNSLRPGENAFSERLPAHMRLNVKGARISQIYRRLLPDQPSYTVTGSGGRWNSCLPLVRTLRALTNRERARLQNCSRHVHI